MISQDIIILIEEIKDHQPGFIRRHKGKIALGALGLGLIGAAGAGIKLYQVLKPTEDLQNDTPTDDTPLPLRRMFKDDDIDNINNFKNSLKPKLDPDLQSSLNKYPSSKLLRTPWYSNIRREVFDSMRKNVINPNEHTF